MDILGRTSKWYHHLRSARIRPDLSKFSDETLVQGFVAYNQCGGIPGS